MWSNSQHQEVNLAGKMQGKPGQKTGTENFCSYKKVPLSFKWPASILKLLLFYVCTPSHLSGGRYLPLTGIAVSSETSSQIAPALSRLAQPSGLCQRTVLWLQTPGPGLSCVQQVIRCCQSGWLVPTWVCSVWTVQYLHVPTARGVARGIYGFLPLRKKPKPSCLIKANN